MEVTETNSGGGAPAAIRMQSGRFEFHTAASGTSGATFDTERLRITSAGLVGINCTPVAMFEVQKNGIPGIISNYNNSKHIRMSVGGSGGGFSQTTGNFFAFQHQPYADRGTDNNLTERLRIDSTGRISSGKHGVGTHNDANEWFKVQSNDSAANISIVASNDTHSSLNLGDEDDFNIQKIRSDHTNNSLQFFTADACLLYTSPSPRDRTRSRMPSSA